MIGSSIMDDLHTVEVDEQIKLSDMTRLIGEDESSSGHTRPYNVSNNAMEIVEQTQGIDKKNFKRICRLCLNESKLNSFDVDSMVSSMIMYILPEVKLHISADPSVCSECIKILNSSFKFKSLCEDTEQTVKNILETNVNKDLVDLNDHWDIKCGQIICRICLKMSKENDCVKLYDSEEDPLKNMVDKCLPNINTVLTKEPMMCSCCLENLEELFNFVMLCLDTEEKVNYYCEEKMKQTNVDLYKVFLFSQCIDDENGDEEDGTIVKEEDHLIVGESQVSNNTSTGPLSSQDKITPAVIHCKKSGISFIDIPENVEVEHVDMTLDIDPLGEERHHGALAQIEEEKSQNAEDDDFFEEESIPKKRSTLETDFETPYPINIIEAIPLQFLDHVDLSNIPVLDARTNGITPFLSEMVPENNNTNKDILAQLMDEINAPDENDCQEKYEDNNRNTDVKQIHDNFDLEEVHYVKKSSESDQEHSLLANENADLIEDRQKKQATPSVERKTEQTVDILDTEEKCSNINCSKEVAESALLQISDVKNPSVHKKRAFNTNIPRPDRPWLRCNKCTFKTKNSESLQQHEGVHLFTNSNNDAFTLSGTFRCSYCSFETKFAQNLDLHKDIHKFMKHYRCDAPGCDYETKLAACYRQHQKKHNKIRLLCKKCDFSTRSATQLKEHHKKHERKTYKCEICEYFTGFKGKFKKHQKFHEADIFRTRTSSRKRVKCVKYQEP